MIGRFHSIIYSYCVLIYADEFMSYFMKKECQIFYYVGNMPGKLKFQSGLGLFTGIWVLKWATQKSGALSRARGELSGNV